MTGPGGGRVSVESQENTCSGGGFLNLYISRGTDIEIRIPWSEVWRDSVRHEALRGYGYTGKGVCERNG